MKHRVYIDPGHGGADSGAVGINNILEKDINLKVAKIIKKHLLGKDYEVMMSRDSDTTVSLAERVIKANKWEAQVYISIHCNAYNGKAMGVETFAYKDTTSDLARCIHDSVVEGGVYNIDRGVKCERFYVLKHSNMRAALVELGFVDNERDVGLLVDRKDELGKAIVEGIERYFDRKLQSH